jgi:hypothetical protein
MQRREIRDRSIASLRIASGHRFVTAHGTTAPWPELTLADSGGTERLADPRALAAMIQPH